MYEMNRSSLLAAWPALRLAALATVLGLSGCAQMQQQMQQPGYYNTPAASSTTDAISQAEGAYATQGIRAPNQLQFDLRQPAAPASRTAPNTSAVAPVKAAGAAAGTSATGKPVTGSGQTATTAGGQVPAKPYDAAGAPIDLPPGDLSDQKNLPVNVAAQADSLQARLIPEPQSFTGTVPCFHPEMKCTAQRITLSLAPNGRWRARAAYLEQNVQNGPVQVDQGCWRAAPMSTPRIVVLNQQGGVRAEFSMNQSNSLQLVSMNGQSPNLTYTLSRQPDLDPIDELNKTPAPNCP